MNHVAVRRDVVSRPSSAMNHGPRVLYVDQTGQLGGAELCLLDSILERRTQLGLSDHHDQVVLFDEGPFATALRRQNASVHVLSSSDKIANIRKDAGIRQHALAIGSVGRLTWALRRLCRDYDIVYANTAKALLTSSIACVRLGTPLIYHLHDLLTASHFSALNRRLLVNAANRVATHVIANSAATAEAFFAAGGHESKVSVIPNGFDLSQFSHPATTSQIRDELRIGTSPLCALFGRFSPWKGQDVAIRAIAHVPGVHLLLVGDAIFGEQAYTREIRDLVDDLRLTDRVHFLGFRNDVRELMHACDIVVHCSSAPEPFGRVIVEGMLSGTPVIASRGGGAAEIIQEHETGLFCEMGDATSLANRIRHLIDQPGFASKLAERADVVARSKYGLSDCVARMNQVLDEVHQAHSVRRATQRVTL